MCLQRERKSERAGERGREKEGGREGERERGGGEESEGERGSMPIYTDNLTSNLTLATPILNTIKKVHLVHFALISLESPYWSVKKKNNKF